MTKCKQCQRDFNPEPIQAYGKLINPVNCANCREINRITKEQLQRSHRSYTYHIIDSNCDHQFNPGGYCINCGYGRDHS